MIKTIVLFPKANQSVFFGIHSKRQLNTEFLLNNQKTIQRQCRFTTPAGSRDYLYLAVPHIANDALQVKNSFYHAFHLELVSESS